MSFINFEPVEVLSVETDIDGAESGVVLGRYILSQQNKSDTNVYPFYPMDTNFMQLPVRHEIVLGGLVKYRGKHYYMSKLSIQNSPIANTQPNISTYSLEPPETEYELGEYFKFNPNGSRKLVTREGDTIIQGRFGNSIRLGSNQVRDLKFDEQNSTDYIDSPNIKIVSGIKEYPTGDKVLKNTYEEELEQEINSIYLTTKENISFKYNQEDFEFTEPQITIQSDNIVFHGRENFDVYSPSINLGMIGMQPAVKGTDLVSKLGEILDVVLEVMGEYTPLPNPTIIARIQETRVKIATVKQELNDCLSNNVNIS